MSFRIERPITAFANERPSKQKRPREKDDGYLKLIRQLPCVVCGARPVDPAHIRMASPQFAKRLTGKAEKPHDKWTTPLCRAHHDEQHEGSEAAFWNRHGIDPLSTALALWSERDDPEAMEQIIRNARRKEPA